MEFSTFSEFQEYQKIYIIVLLSLTFCYSIYLSIQYKFLKGSNILGLLFFFLLVAFFIGFSPFCPYSDKHMYLIGFENILQSTDLLAGKDVAWSIYSYICALYMSPSIWFLFTACLYVFGFLKFSQCYFKTYSLPAFLLFINFFLFFAYGINTIRGGLASSILFISLCYYRKRNILFLILAFISVQIHGSMLLPLAAFIFTKFYHQTKFLFYFWLLCIPLSAAAGHTFEVLFAPLAEDRSGFLEAVDDSTLYKTGFRIDFILYSLVPVLMGYYHTYKHKVQDAFYQQIFGTYLITNAFWILVIRTNFSDRIAYLSWMFYPILLAYPYAQKYYKAQKANFSFALCLFGEASFYMLLSLRDW